MLNYVFYSISISCSKVVYHGHICKSKYVYAQNIICSEFESDAEIKKKVEKELKSKYLLRYNHFKPLWLG